MEDIPQPATDPYSVGDRVRIYLDADDPDAELHGTVCEVVDVFVDDLGAETSRDLDAYAYDLRAVDSDRELSVPFRHRDLVPVEADQ
ncbi:hypothetical protein [Halosimplex marinum]|uniref:hypothetical protein n=1 Tax=Halosimplex marinum TaxID=3396620 RepID=UPI003F54C458